MNISLVMIVKNAERSLKRCLQSAAPLVDQMIVADTGSTDRTREIAAEAGARVLSFQWRDDFSAARNFALDHSDADWNLILDSDEYLRSPSRKKLEQSVRRLSGLYGTRWMGAILRYDTFPGTDGNEVSISPIPRFLPAGVRYSGIIHEQPHTDFPCYQIPLEADHDGYLFENKGARNLAYLYKAVEQEPEDSYYRFQLAATLRNLGKLPEALEQFRAFYGSCPGASGYRTEGILLYLYTLMDIGSLSCLTEARGIIDKEQARLSGRADYWFVCGLFYMKLVLADTASYIGFLPEIEASYLTCLQIGEHPEQGGVIGTGSFKAAYNLACWYEVSGQREKAADYYRLAAKHGYQPALKRLAGMDRSQP